MGLNSPEVLASNAPFLPPLKVSRSTLPSEQQITLDRRIMNQSKSDLIVIASAKARPGKEAELKRALLEAAGPTRRQPGCVSFSLYHSAEDPATIIAFERWASALDHEQHLRGPHVQTLMSRISEVLAEPPKVLSYGITDET